MTTAELSDERRDGKEIRKDWETADRAVAVLATRLSPEAPRMKHLPSEPALKSSYVSVLADLARREVALRNEERPVGLVVPESRLRIRQVACGTSRRAPRITASLGSFFQSPSLDHSDFHVARTLAFVLY